MFIVACLQKCKYFRLIEKTFYLCDALVQELSVLEDNLVIKRNQVRVLGSPAAVNSILYKCRKQSFGPLEKCLFPGR